MLELYIVGDVYLELLRVVDKDGNNTNTILEREELHNRSLLHNEVTIYVINNKKEVLLQKRSPNRRFCPNKLGVVAGHVSYNENPSRSAIRELKEEIGLRINRNDLYVLCDKYVVKERFNNHYMYSFYTVSDKKEEEFKVQREELSYVKWYKIEQVIDMIKNNDLSTVFKEKEIAIFSKLKDISDSLQNM